MNRSEYLTIAAVIILAGGLIFVYATTSNEITNLNQAGKALCKQAQASGSQFSLFARNLTSTLQRQIQNDKTIISALNSTRPLGYEGAIALINTQVSQANSIMASLESLATFNVLPPQSDPCSSFQP